MVQPPSNCSPCKNIYWCCDWFNSSLQLLPMSNKHRCSGFRPVHLPAHPHSHVHVPHTHMDAQLPFLTPTTLPCTLVTPTAHTTHTLPPHTHHTHLLHVCKHTHTTHASPGLAHAHTQLPELTALLSAETLSWGHMPLPHMHTSTHMPTCTCSMMLVWTVFYRNSIVGA